MNGFKAPTQLYVGNLVFITAEKRKKIKGSHSEKAEPSLRGIILKCGKNLNEIVKGSGVEEGEGEGEEVRGREHFFLNYIFCFKSTDTSKLLFKFQSSCKEQIIGA